MTETIDLSAVPYEVLSAELKRRREIDFYARVNTINTVIDELLERGCPILDIDNPDYRITGVKYDVEEDAIYFYTKEQN